MNGPFETASNSSGCTSYTLVRDSSGFDRMLETILPASRLAVDIEADSLYHYFDKVCLIQISTASRTFVLDTLAVRELKPLGNIFRSPDVEKVFHAANYDTFCLGRDYGFTFAGIFDTHVAGQLLGYEQLGLGTLLEKLLGIRHSKRMQRDDWSRRPLDAEQLEYAAKDTHHLLELRDLLEAGLVENGRLAWAREEFEIAAATAPQEKTFDPEGFRRIKGSKELSLQELAVLRALFLLRDSFARQLDLPPFKVLNSPTLIELARRPPATLYELFDCPGISQRLKRRYGSDMVRAIQKARAEDPAYLALPPRRPWRQPSAEARKRLERLKDWRKEKAHALRLHVGVVFPGNILESIAFDPPADLAGLESLDGMRRWRAREFGAEILEVLRS